MRRRRKPGNPARLAAPILLPVMLTAASFCAQGAETVVLPEAEPESMEVLDPNLDLDWDLDPDPEWNLPPTPILEETLEELSLDPFWEEEDDRDFQAAQTDGWEDLWDSSENEETELWEADSSTGGDTEGFDAVPDEAEDLCPGADLMPASMEEVPEGTEKPEEAFEDPEEVPAQPAGEGEKLTRMGGFALPQIQYSLEGLEESEDLYEGYAASLFASDPDGASGTEEPRPVGKVTRGSLLKGQAALVYERLKERVLQVAAGEESSTVVTISLEELGVEPRYSAEDLGLATLTSPDGASVTEEARAALNGKLQVEMYGVLGALMADLPYELYWYDKTVGIAFGAPSIGLYAAGEREYLIFEGIAPAVRFSMTVMTTYRVGMYETDQRKTGAALQAAENAKALVRRCAGLNDIEKLEAYRDYILEQVSYATWAVNQYAQDGIYADAWQMVHVFDEDPETNVVCEGYAKAFAYLCDQTEFDDPAISCALVTGDIYTDGGGGGAHMWNNVQIGDHIFLTDLTNCDSDEGYTCPELFLGGTELTVSDSDGDTGYLFDLGNEEYILYFYDTETLRLYSEEELAVSRVSYAKLQAGGAEEPENTGEQETESETENTGKQEPESETESAAETGTGNGSGSGKTGNEEGYTTGSNSAGSINPSTSTSASISPSPSASISTSNESAVLKKKLKTLQKQEKARDKQLKKLQTTYEKLKVQAKKVSGVKAKAKKKTFQVSWKKLSGMDGYEIYVSAKKTSGYKKAASGSAKSKKAVVRKLKGKKLKSGKIYYVKVRAFRKIGGKKVYTGFGATKKVRVK